MVNAKLCRNEVNKRTGRIVRAFKWGVENELIPPSVHHGLKAVPGLRRGRSEVKESEPVKPVPEPHVEAVRPHVSRQVWAMIQLQRLTAILTGEVCQIRTWGHLTGNPGVSGRTTPENHKGATLHGKNRTICHPQAIPWKFSAPGSGTTLPPPCLAPVRRRRNGGRSGVPRGKLQ